jgi:putative oxidoreductase
MYMTKSQKVVTGILFVIFLLEGITKLVGVEFQVTAFTQQWNYPLWFMYVTGTIETLCAFFLLYRHTHFLANIALLCVMAGAFYTHITSGDPVMFMTLALITTILLVVRLFLMRKNVSRPFGYGGKR